MVRGAISDPPSPSIADVLEIVEVFEDFRACSTEQDTWSAVKLAIAGGLGKSRTLRFRWRRVTADCGERQDEREGCEQKLHVVRLEAYPLNSLVAK